METDPDALVQELSERACLALRVGKGRLLTSSGETLDGAATLKRARIEDRDMLTLQAGSIKLASSKKNSTITIKKAAFAAVLGDSSVVSWGDAKFGGSSDWVQDQLQSVVDIQASYKAGTLCFCGASLTPYVADTCFERGVGDGGAQERKNESRRETRGKGRKEERTKEGDSERQ